MKKSELEMLREEVTNLNNKISLLQEELNSLMADLKIPDIWVPDKADSPLPNKYLVQQMMIDKLRENWDMLQLEDIEAICRV
jgi:hypothetical protein